jgi:hypothetical protein
VELNARGGEGEFTYFRGFKSRFLYFCRQLQRFCSQLALNTYLKLLFLFLASLLSPSSHMRMDDEGLGAKNDHSNFRSYLRRKDGIFKRIILEWTYNQQ